MHRPNCPTCRTPEPRVRIATREQMYLRCDACGDEWASQPWSRRIATEALTEGTRPSPVQAPAEVNALPLKPDHYQSTGAAVSQSVRRARSAGGVRMSVVSSTPPTSRSSPSAFRAARIWSAQTSFAAVRRTPVVPHRGRRAARARRCRVVGRCRLVGWRAHPSRGAAQRPSGGPSRRSRRDGRASARSVAYGPPDASYPAPDRTLTPA